MVMSELAETIPHHSMRCQDCWTIELEIEPNPISRSHIVSFTKVIVTALKRAQKISKCDFTSVAEPEPEPEPKLRNFFGSGSGSSQKGRLRAAPAPKHWVIYT